MARWDEAWLRQYQGRRSVAVDLPDQFGFTLDKPTLSLNRWTRMHWAKQREYAAELSDEIRHKTMHLPACTRPMERARVTITRYSLRPLDADNLAGSVKQLLDCLLVRSNTHPHGLGFLRDDSPAHMELVVRSENVSKRAVQRTEVLIERLPTKKETE